MSILQYFKCVPVKPKSALDERANEQLPEPNGSLSKSVPATAIELANAEMLKLKDKSTTREQNRAISDANTSPEV